MKPMMYKTTIHIPEKSHSYTVFIGEDMLKDISRILPREGYSKIAVITDSNVQKPWLVKLQSGMESPLYPLVLPPGEKVKTIDTVTTIWNHLLKNQFDRNSLVINLGGGVIGDMGGFAASTYMRGIEFIQIPTSITAQVDAMVGGKLGINLNEFKNYIGTFTQPSAVIIDIETLKTLPKRAFLEGFAEIIKHGLLIDRNYFEKVTAKKPFEFTNSELAEIILRSVEIKAKIVETDATEKGLRKILNFGHTIGHAIESLSFTSSMPLMHGEAILLGMIVETRISELQKLLSHEESEYVIHKLKDTGLQTTIHFITEEDILRNIMFDKKIENGVLQWTLLEKIGRAKYNQQVSENIIRTALKEIR